MQDLLLQQRAKFQHLKYCSLRRKNTQQVIRERSESKQNIAPSLKASYDYNPRGHQCDSPEDKTTSSLFTRGSPDDKFVVYKGGDGLLNKLYEAQLFIQQAVAENSVFYFSRACASVRIHSRSVCGMDRHSRL